MSAFESITRQLGLPRLDFEIDEYSRGKIMRASILPGIVFVAALIRLGIELVLESPISFGGFAGLGGDDTPDEWARLHRMMYQLGHLKYVAVASMFVAGMARWSRQEGSWMLLIGGVLGGLSVFGGVFLAVLFAASDDGEFLYVDLRSYSFELLAETLGILAIGYCFLAYRALTSTEETERTNSGTPEPLPDDTLLEG
jgi:hypothetical protein